jgi:hypothetical protein
VSNTPTTQKQSLANIAKSQSARRVPVNTARTLNPYTPQTGQAPGGSSTFEMLVNGGFSGSADGWTVGAGGLYDGNSEMKFNGGALAVVCAQLVEESVIGQDYRVAFNIISVSAGGVQFNYGGVNGTPQTTVGRHVQDITATSATQVFDITCGSGGGVGIVDSVTLRKI